MNILIVESDVISSSKLKLFYTKYGDCFLAASGQEAIRLFIKNSEAGQPFGFISLDSSLSDLKGKSVLEEIRKWENQKGIETGKLSKILAITSPEDIDEMNTAIKTTGESAAVLLVKPYNRNSLEDALDRLNLKKLAPEQLAKKTTASSPPKTKPAATKASPKQADPQIVAEVTKKITAFINNAGQFKGIDAPKLLAELALKGGEEAHILLAQYSSSDRIPIEVRLEVIRSARYLKSPHFLVPLNRIINSENNIKTIQEAIISIARYDNQRALNLLNQGLKKFKNPILLNTIRTEIDRIKKQKPVLAILPRFLQSYKNVKNFRVTVDILKKIVTPIETPMFLNYLKSGNQVLEDGTFEVLCFSGDPAIKTAIFNYFDDRAPKIPGFREKECYDLYMMVSHLFTYFRKNPAFIDEQLDELRELFTSILDVRVKQIIITTLSASRRPEALEFIKGVYNEEKDLQEHIIEKLSGNQQAVDFLFEKYHQGKALKEKVIVSLLKSEQGLQYFVKNFFTFELDQQEVIIKNIPYSNKDYLVEFINRVYESSLYGLKFHLLKILKENYLFSFKHILFDEDHQREFMFMGKEYLETIMELFPITTLKMFFHKIANEDLSNSKVKKFLTKIIAIGGAEPVLYFNDPKFINRLFTRVINANNIELNTMFFTSFENIKILDLQSYRYLLDATNTFIEVRGENINPKEKGPISRVKSKLREQLPDIRDIENLQKELMGAFAEKPVELPKLDNIIESNHIAVALRVHHVAAFLAKMFNTRGVIEDDTKQLFFLKYPILGEFIKFLSNQEKIAVQKNWGISTGKNELLKHFKNQLRIIAAFKDKRKSAFLKDQLLEMLPEFQVLLDDEFMESGGKLSENDFLVCDTVKLKQLIVDKTLNTGRIFLYLESRADFPQFRAYNPRVFMTPFSGFRIVRMLLKELYLHK